MLYSLYTGTATVRKMAVSTAWGTNEPRLLRRRLTRDILEGFLVLAVRPIPLT